MSNQQLATLSAEDWRTVLVTCRQLRSSGILRADYFEQLMKKFPRIIPSGGSEFAFYKFIEDYNPSGTLARRCDKLGTVYDPTSTAVTITHNESWNRPAGAKAGYVCLAWGRRFFQGPCPDTSCDVGESFIDAGTPPEGYANEAYTHTITWGDLVSNPTLTGLPDGLTYNSTTGEITGTTELSGVFTIIVTGISEENGCPITVAFNLIINPCRVEDAYIDPDDPPALTVDVAYSHTVLLNDVTITDWGGLPPGITFDSSTGELAGTCEEEGSWTVWIEGTTDPNGCKIRVEFTLSVGPCDAEDSRLLHSNSNFPLAEGEPVFVQVFGYRTTGDIELYAVEECCPTNTFPFVCTPTSSALPSGLTYDETTGILSGIPDDSINDCRTEPCHYVLKFRARSETNDCWVYVEVQLFYPCPCPPPYSYDTLGAWLVESGSATSSISESVGWTETLVSSNAIFTSSDAGSGWTIIGEGTGTIDIFQIGIDPGTYIIKFFGLVVSGPYAGCPIEHTRTITLS